MGGSLGMALARKGWRVVGLGRSPEKLKRARKRGAVHEWTTDLSEGARDVDAAVLAVPVEEIVPLARALRPRLPPHCLVMDAGSVKEPVVRGLDKVYGEPDGPSFVGAHPLCGSEKTGVENARADLYRDAVCVITPGPRTPAPALRRAERFWRDLGARTLRLSPAEHDRWLAVTSHLPHLLADALVLTADGWGDRSLAPLLSAGSFRDMTRVAGADPALWSQIFRLNAAPLRRAVRAFQTNLKRLARAGRSSLEKVKKTHEQFLKRTSDNG